MEYRKQCLKANSLITKSLQDHNRHRIEETGSNSKQKWQGINKLLYPSRNDDSTSPFTPSAFVNFFMEKDNNIRQLISAARSSFQDDPLANDPIYYGELFSSVEPVSPEEVSKIISSMPNKTSPVDIFPTSLLKSFPDLFGSIISTLTNKTFEQGIFPSSFKSALVKPILKKKGLDANNL